MIARPVRRWLASVTDALVLFLVHLLVVAPIVYFAPDPFDSLKQLTFASPLACWIYLWWGWSRGQTPGQRAWKVRVIADDGAPMTPPRALKRLLGYALVCGSLKIGLLPILFDPLRRGWHDRFAATLVVDARAPAPTSAALRAALAQAAAQEYRDSTRRALPAMPDFALARRGWPLVFLAYLALSVALTWPVALTWRTALAGDGGDAWVFVWNNWFFARAVATGGPFLSTDLLFQGFQTPLLFHTMNWFDCVLAWPLLYFFSPVATYNLLFLLTPALCALAAYWLACSLSRAPLASFLVAPVFGFSPYFMAHGLGHANLTSAQMLPIFAALLYAAIVSGRARYAVGASVALALAGLCDWQYLLFGFIVALALWGGTAWALGRAGQKLGVRRAVLVAGALLGAGLLLSPMLLPLLRESGNASYMNRSRQAGGFSAAPGDWTRAGKLHPFFHSASARSTSNENDLTPGWCLLTLCAAGVSSRRRRQQLTPWLCLASGAWVLACGPLLNVNWNALLSVLGLGAPGNGFNPPWNTAQLVTLSAHLSLGLSPAINGENIEMPFSWLAPYLPMLKAFRVPARLGVLVLMCCAPIAAVGLNGLLTTGANKRAWLKPLLATSVALLIGFEYLTWPFPTSDISVPAFYRRIARDPQRYAVVDVPIETSQRYGGWQVVHGKSTVVGVVARCPPEVFGLVARNPLLRALSAKVFTVPGARDNKLPPANFDYAPALRELQTLNVRYLVVHKGQIVGEKGQRINALLHRLQLPTVFEDAETRVYQVEIKENAS